MGSYAPDEPSLAEDNGVDIPEPAETLHQILSQSARQHPRRTALVSCHQQWDLLPSLGHTQDSSKNGYLCWTYAQLENASERLSSYLTKSGISKGDALVIVVHSCA